MSIYTNNNYVLKVKSEFLHSLLFFCKKMSFKFVHCVDPETALREVHLLFGYFDWQFLGAENYFTVKI